MDKTELLQDVRTRIQPDGMDVETAQRIILEFLHSVSQGTYEPLGSSQIISYVSLQKQAFEKPLSVTSGYEPLLEDQLLNLRTELAAREALLSLHAHGVLLAYGPLLVAPDGHSALTRDLHFNPNNGPYNNNPESIGPLYFPSVHSTYRIAALFQEDQTSRLTSGTIYLSYLDQEHLPSRAKRCLRESMEAFRYGLYLSATMSVGAASESLWMQIGLRLLSTKPSLTRKLGEHLKLHSPSISLVIDEAWQVLLSHFDIELKQIFATKGERNVFKDHATRLCDRRNYAMHSEEADEDEPYFTRTETAYLLTGSIGYFNQLTRLLTIIEGVI